MQVQNHTHVANPAQNANSASSGSSQSANPSIDGLANENTFLQLLVAQIKNQDPLNPTDSIQFLGQLAQFSQLEQLIGIRQELKPAAAPAATNQNGGANAATN